MLYIWNRQWEQERNGRVLREINLSDDEFLMLVKEINDNVWSFVKRDAPTIVASKDKDSKPLTSGRSRIMSPLYHGITEDI